MRLTRIISRPLAIGILMTGLSISPVSAQTERTVDIPTRPGQSVRALLTAPQAPKGSVILLAGGHGNLKLSADGRLGWGVRNQVVRTRQMYAAAGYVTLVPDIAPDLKLPDGVIRRYRWSAAHAEDIGALVAYLRTVAEPVHLIGTSRAALSVANAAARTSGRQRPDTIVITSGMLMHEQDGKPSVQRVVPNLHRITQATLLVAHEDDKCFVTPPSAPRRFAPLLSRAERVDIKVLGGGVAASGDACGPESPHGFKGMDAVVVRAILDWLHEVGSKNPPVRHAN